MVRPGQARWLHRPALFPDLCQGILHQATALSETVCFVERRVFPPMVLSNRRGVESGLKFRRNSLTNTKQNECGWAGPFCLQEGDTLVCKTSASAGVAQTHRDCGTTEHNHARGILGKFASAPYQSYMNALTVTPSRWFSPVFEVPVIRRLPCCCHEPGTHPRTTRRQDAHLRRSAIRDHSKSTGLSKPPANARALARDLVPAREAGIGGVID